MQNSMRDITETGHRKLLEQWRKEIECEYKSQTASNALERFADWLDMKRAEWLKRNKI